MGLAYFWVPMPELISFSFIQENIKCHPFFFKKKINKTMRHLDT